MLSCPCIEGFTFFNSGTLEQKNGASSVYFSPTVNATAWMLTSLFWTCWSNWQSSFSDGASVILVDESNTQLFTTQQFPSDDLKDTLSLLKNVCLLDNLCLDRTEKSPNATVSTSCGFGGILTKLNLFRAFKNCSHLVCWWQQLFYKF